ncbi:unnamed protein product [Zymoseptoria tritici ST99CH_1A5]|uniref:GIY-YIG domain-containing protein n=1 Tax=Zymoseptoria tritici ST99CH_1A5 TaxID=1276529 RepID=A0A1Y6LYY5_ZYMTR|nr:unnamed protein product [Zymoseptoria tritici ST99CH_1A5]
MIRLQQILRGSRTLQRNLAPRRCVLSSMPRPLFAPSPSTRVQASSILTVCHLEGHAPRWSASKRYHDLDESSAKDVKDLDRITFLFLRDGYNTRVTWTFQFAKYPENLLEQLLAHNCCPSGRIEDELAAAFRTYVVSLVNFNKEFPYFMVAEPLYVRFGFNSPKGYPRMENTEVLKIEPRGYLPNKWSFETVASGSKLARLLHRERELTSSELPYAELLAGFSVDADRPLDHIWLSRWELEQVAACIRRGTHIVWTNDDIQKFLSLAKLGRSSKEMAAEMTKSHFAIQKAKEKLARPKLAKLRAAMNVELSDPNYSAKNQAWATLVRASTRTWWADKDVGKLVELRKDGWPLTRIADKLDRKPADVQKALRLLGTGPFHTATSTSHNATASTSQDSTEVLPELSSGDSTEEVFHRRLTEVWTCLLDSVKTPAWTRIIATRTKDEWLSQISDGIGSEVRTLLAGTQCPTFQELNALPLLMSTDAGVYARLVESRYEVQFAIDRMVYVGSASKYNAGLAGRIAEHASKLKNKPGRKRKTIPRLQITIEARKLRWPGNFATLMVLSFPSSKPQDVYNVRATVVIAEAMLTIWLGALQDPPPNVNPSPRLFDAFPWNLAERDYTPWSSHNPLLVDFTLPWEMDPCIREVQEDEEATEEVEHIAAPDDVQGSSRSSPTTHQHWISPDRASFHPTSASGTLSPDSS